MSLSNSDLRRWRNNQDVVTGMDKTSGHSCPRCGAMSLDIFYEDDGDLELGAVCEECGFRGFSLNGKLVQLATA